MTHPTDKLTTMRAHTHVIEYDGGVLVEEVGGPCDVSTFANPLRHFNGRDQWALTLYPLPDDMTYDEMQAAKKEPTEYLQVGGLPDAMTVEIRKPGACRTLPQLLHNRRNPIEIHTPPHRGLPRRRGVSRHTCGANTVMIRTPTAPPAGRSDQLLNAASDGASRFVVRATHKPRVGVPSGRSLATASREADPVHSEPLRTARYERVDLGFARSS